MSSINSKTNADVIAAFNKLNKDAATNDSSMGTTVKEDAVALTQALMTDGDLPDTEKKSFVQMAAALLPLAGEAGNGAEWNEDMQALVNSLAALPAGTTASSQSLASTNSSASTTTNAQVFSAYNALNTMAASSNSSGNSTSIQTAAQSLLSMVEGDSSLTASQQSDLETKITNLISIAGKSGHGSEWNTQMQALVDTLSAIAKGSTSTSSTSGSSGSASSSATGTSSSSGTATPTSTSSNSGTTVVPTSSSSASLSDTTLYPSGNGPTLEDIQQGSLADCTIDASLSSLVQNDPSAIENMLSKNSDGTYNVTLYPAGVKTTVTINPSTDLLSGGTTGQNGKADWASIIEAAASKVGFAVNSATGAQPGDAMQLLTGTEGMAGNTSDFGSTSTLGTALQTELSSGKIVIAGTPTASTVNGTAIDANHAYSVLSVSNGEVTLRNPWKNQANNGIVTMSLADYQKAFAWTYMED